RETFRGLYDEERKRYYVIEGADVMRLTAVWIPALLAAASALAQQNVASPDFIKDVQPILIANCSACHNGSSAPAGLRLDTAGGLLQGSSSGKVIAPGNSKQSLLAQRITNTTGEQMPPTKPLTPKEIAVIVNWID